MDSWFLLLASREDWHIPDSVHIAARSKQLNNSSEGSWCLSATITFLVTLEQKTALESYIEGSSNSYLGSKGLL